MVTFSRMPLRVAVAVCAVSLAAFAFAGCVSQTHGTLAVYVKGTPSEDFSSVEVTFTRVLVERAGAGIGDGQDPTVDRGAGEDGEPAERTLMTVSTDRVTVELLEYREASSRALLGNDLIGEGAYQQVVLRYADDARGVLRDGSPVTFDLPIREAQQGVAFAVTASRTTHVVLEIDLDESITQNEDGTWRFTPRLGEAQVDEDTAREPAGQRDRGV